MPLKFGLSLAIALFLNAQFLYAQRSGIQKEVAAETSKNTDSKRTHTLRWKEPRLVNNSNTWIIEFEGAALDPATNLPLFLWNSTVPGSVGRVDVQLINESIEPLPASMTKNVNSQSLSQWFDVKAEVKKAGSKNILSLSVVPMRLRNGNIERLTAFDLDIKTESSVSGSAGRSSRWTSQSILSSGTWFRIATLEDAPQKITPSFLKDCGFDVNDLPSDRVRVFGYAPGPLAMENGAQRQDDLREIPLKMIDGGDGVFDGADFALFYGQDQVTWSIDGQEFRHVINPYGDSVYFYVTTDAGVGPPIRINTFSEANSANYVSTTYNYRDYHHRDLTNLIKSGRDWFGEQLGAVPYLDFEFDVPDVDRNSPARLRTRFAVRSVSIPGVVVTTSISSQGGVQSRDTMNAVPNAYAALYAQNATRELVFNPQNSNFQTRISLNNSVNSGALAWIDYLELNARRSLKFTGPVMHFRDMNSVGNGRITEFRINSNEDGLSLWDVSDPFGVSELQYTGSVVNGFRIAVRTDSLREFMMFSESAIKTPYKVGLVANQNLHGMAGVEYIVITHPMFLAYAEQLKQTRESVDGLSSAVVNVEHIFNEFSGGVRDITAIKEFLRMLYIRAANGNGVAPRYVVLFGDGSYDYKNRVSGNTNLIPTYQTRESLAPTASVVSDDYFGLLDDNEGEGLGDQLDMAIGRIPARSKQEAEHMVAKIIQYSTSPSSLGDWRNWVTFVADDSGEDGTIFMEDSDFLEEIIDSLAPEYNVRKLYLDAFKQQAGSGGQRYPDAAQAITDRVTRGTLFMYYMGHGGELGWAHERVLEVPAINAWSNTNNLPIFLTATCEFTRFDDPQRTSAGEYVLLNPNGGGSALLTTTRAVFAGPNFQLTKSFTENAFEMADIGLVRIGDIIRQTKIENTSVTTNGLNTRCFLLMGDPAMPVAFPREQVIITSVPDTIRALEKIKIKGYVADHNGVKLTKFNGLVYPTVFDKKTLVQTLNNDGKGAYSYLEWKNMIFRGKASVKAGEFEFEFVTPKDLNRNFGGGKLSLYAHNGQTDANGVDVDFTVGGLSDNPITDSEGPQTDLYMNNSKFVFGGLTDENPDIYAEIWDENGINMVGTGIGHDIIAILDNKGSNAMVLNDYYESDVDSYQSGKVRYPLSALTDGRHMLKLQVWDVNNNPTDAYTEFVVASSEELVLAHVLNYPNPFTTNTDFYFEHNKPGLHLDVRIEVFTISGRLVKQLDGTFGSDGFRVGPINWNGRDEFGDPMGKGVYVYKLEVKTPTGDHAEVFERLVLLR